MSIYGLTIYTLELKLFYVYLFRANNVADAEELKKLAVLPTLRALVLLGKLLFSIVFLTLTFFL